MDFFFFRIITRSYLGSGVQVSWHACGGQRTTCSSQSALSTMWVLGTQVITIGGKSLYPPCHLPGPKFETLAPHQIPLSFKVTHL